MNKLYNYAYHMSNGIDNTRHFDLNPITDPYCAARPFIPTLSQNGTVILLDFFLNKPIEDFRTIKL
jgi:hypothetical protein